MCATRFARRRRRQRKRWPRCSRTRIKCLPILVRSDVHCVKGPAALASAALATSQVVIAASLARIAKLEKQLADIDNTRRDTRQCL